MIFKNILNFGLLTSIFRLPSSVFILLLFLSNTIYAQNMGGGWVLGMNASQVMNDRSGGYNQFGLSVGGYVEFKLSDQFVITPELLWDQLGSAAGAKDPFLLSVRYNYLSVPLTGSFVIPIDLGTGVRDLKFHAGGILGVLLGARNKIDDQTITQFYRTTDFRVAGGVNFDMSRQLSFCARYSYSIFALDKASTPSSPAGLRNKAVHFSIRWHLVN